MEATNMSLYGLELFIMVNRIIIMFNLIFLVQTPTSVSSQTATEIQTKKEEAIIQAATRGI